MTTEADRIIGLYQRHGLAWAKDRGRHLQEKAWLDRFLGLMPAQARVLDLGCGSGEPMAGYLIGRGCVLSGVDTSPALLGLCRERFPQGDWRLEDMRTLALGRRFDGILAWDSFFHLAHEDQRRMFAIFRAHAAAGAALMFTSGTGHGVAMGCYAGEPLYHASLEADEYRALLEAQGFEVAAHVVEDADCGGHTVWLARLR